MVLLSQFERYDGYDGEENGDDDESYHNLFLCDMLLLVMVMEGSHQKGTFLHRYGLSYWNVVTPTIEFATRGLDDDGEVLDEVDSAEYGEQ